jgi:hypothetical protein
MDDDIEIYKPRRNNKFFNNNKVIPNSDIINDDNNNDLSDDENINLSDEENYEEEVDKMTLFEKEYPMEEYDSEEERHLRELIFKKSQSCNYFQNATIDDDKKPEIKKNKKERKTMSLNDLYKMVDKKKEENKPKKFISKRSEEKKKTFGIDNKTESKPIVKRQFNPRLVPYFHSEEYKKLKKISVSFSNEDFPSL